MLAHIVKTSLRPICRSYLTSSFNQLAPSIRYGPASAFSRRSLTSAGSMPEWPDKVRVYLQNQGINTPTPIQEKTFAVATAKKNLVGIARTGSGKTLAFLLPAIARIAEEKEKQKEVHSKVRCLVLTPTRELGAQVQSVFEKFRSMNVKSTLLVGGRDRPAQVAQLSRHDSDACVGTPGRVQDLIDSGILDTTSVNYLVLDEADRMLDMGFEPQIRAILRSIDPSSQILMYSATWPEEVHDLAKDFLKDYEYIAVDSPDLKPNPNIEQKIIVTEGYTRYKKLVDILRELGFSQNQGSKSNKALIFVNTKRSADELEFKLMADRFKVVVMHGGKTQSNRDRSMNFFRSSQRNMMIATAVAARGIDVSDITHVINYDFPEDLEEYVHRIGRTARHDRKGTAISFFTEKNHSVAQKLVKILRDSDQTVDEHLLEIAKNSPSRPPRSRSQGYGSRDHYSSFDRPYNRSYGRPYENRFSRQNDRSYDRQSTRQFDRHYERQ